MAREIQRRIGHEQLITYAECVWRGWQWDGDTGEVVVDADGRPLRQIPPPSDADRRWAHTFLSDRGYGKPVLALDVNAMISTAAADPLEGAGVFADLDVDALEGDDLQTLEAIVMRAIGKAPRPALPVVDVEFERREPNVAPLLAHVDGLAEEPEPEPLPAPAPEAPEPATVTPTPSADTRERFAFVKSSNVEGYAYDPTSAIVTVRFKGGSTYQYANVTPELLGEWRVALSPGQWLTTRLKARADLHPCRKVSDAEWGA